MLDVGQQKDIHVNWKFFSLKLINKGREVKEDKKILHEIGHKALRVSAAVRREFGNDGAGEIYTVQGARYHHDQEDIDEPSALEEILQTCGFPTKLAKAADEEIWDNDIAADMDQAIAKAGTDVGVPLIVLDGGKGAGFFRPCHESGSYRQGGCEVLGWNHRRRQYARVFSSLKGRGKSALCLGNVQRQSHKGRLLRKFPLSEA